LWGNTRGGSSPLSRTIFSAVPYYPTSKEQGLEGLSYRLRGPRQSQNDTAKYCYKYVLALAYAIFARVSTGLTPLTELVARTNMILRLLMKNAHHHFVLYLGSYSLAFVLHRQLPVLGFRAKAKKRQSAFLILSNAWRSIVLSYCGGRLRWFADRTPYPDPIV
jgi:hypothetical protein